MTEGKAVLTKQQEIFDEFVELCAELPGRNPYSKIFLTWRSVVLFVPGVWAVLVKMTELNTIIITKYQVWVGEALLFLLC